MIFYSINIYIVTRWHPKLYNSRKYLCSPHRRFTLFCGGGGGAGRGGGQDQKLKLLKDTIGQDWEFQSEKGQCGIFPSSTPCVHVSYNLFIHRSIIIHVFS